MQISSEWTSLLKGAAIGALGAAILGFTWGGWVTASGADSLAKQSASKALVMALAPICAENFKRGTDVDAQLLALRKVSTWEQGGFIEKGGWAKMPGTATVDAATARACADLIVASKS